MVKVNGALTDVKTLAELIEHLGGIPIERVRFSPLPGTATEEDVVAAEHEPRKSLCELIDGVLVEKPMGVKESTIALVIGQWLLNYLDDHDVGAVLGESAQLRLWPGRVRMPDISFIAWERLPNNEMPDEPIPDLFPDLAIEVLSRSNTKKEMQLKRRDYFQSGVREVWEIQPKTRTAEVYTSPTKHRHIGEDGTLDGGDILPGFTLPLKELFTRSKKKK